MWTHQYWIGMCEDVQEWYKACVVCQQAKPGIGRGWIPLHQECVNRPNRQAAMDLAVLPHTPEGYHYLLVYQDYYSKFIELFPLKEKMPRAVAEKLVIEIFTRYGVVKKLHSDQGKEYLTQL